MSAYLLIDKTDRKQESYLLLGLSLPFFRSIQKISKLLPAGFYTPLYPPFLVKAKGYKSFFLANLFLSFQALRLLVLLVIDIQSC